LNYLEALFLLLHGPHLVDYLVGCDEPPLQVRLGTNATNDTLAPYSGTCATCRAAHGQGLGFNQIAGYHYSIVTADWAGVCAILNSLKFKLHHSDTKADNSGREQRGARRPADVDAGYLASERT
jgi:hypothetical protein